MTDTDTMTTLIEEWKIIDFGKYKSKSIDYILENDMNYAKWIFEHPTLTVDDNVRKILENIFKDKDDHYLNFGKYKNKSLTWIKQNDKKYIDYLKKNDYVKNKMESLFKAL